MTVFFKVIFIYSFDFLNVRSLTGSFTDESILFYCKRTSFCSPHAEKWRDEPPDRFLSQRPQLSAGKRAWNRQSMSWRRHQRPITGRICPVWCDTPRSICCSWSLLSRHHASPTRDTLEAADCFPTLPSWGRSSRWPAHQRVIWECWRRFCSRLSRYRSSLYFPVDTESRARLAAQTPTTTIAPRFPIFPPLSWRTSTTRLSRRTRAWEKLRNKWILKLIDLNKHSSLSLKQCRNIQRV